MAVGPALFPNPRRGTGYSLSPPISDERTDAPWNNVPPDDGLADAGFVRHYSQLPCWFPRRLLSCFTSPPCSPFARRPFGSSFLVPEIQGTGCLASIRLPKTTLAGASASNLVKGPRLVSDKVIFGCMSRKQDVNGVWRNRYITVVSLVSPGLPQCPTSGSSFMPRNSLAALALLFDTASSPRDGTMRGPLPPPPSPSGCPQLPRAFPKTSTSGRCFPPHRTGCSHEQPRIERTESPPLPRSAASKGTRTRDASLEGWSVTNYTMLASLVLSPRPGGSRPTHVPPRPVLLRLPHTCPPSAPTTLRPDAVTPYAPFVRQDPHGPESQNSDKS